jgi:hypothetical protein
MVLGIVIYSPIKINYVDENEILASHVIEYGSFCTMATVIIAAEYSANGSPTKHRQLLDCAITSLRIDYSSQSTALSCGALSRYAEMLITDHDRDGAIQSLARYLEYHSARVRFIHAHRLCSYRETDDADVRFNILATSIPELGARLSALAKYTNTRVMYIGNSARFANHIFSRLDQPSLTTISEQTMPSFASSKHGHGKQVVSIYGSLTSPDIYEKMMDHLTLGGNRANSYKLIIADRRVYESNPILNLDHINYTLSEQSQCVIMLVETIIALNALENGGTFILKSGSLAHPATVDLIHLLSTLVLTFITNATSTNL